MMSCKDLTQKTGLRLRLHLNKLWSGSVRRLL